MTQNLLIGLAVGDIEQIQFNAIAEKRAIEIGFYSRIDGIMTKKALLHFNKGWQKSFPNKNKKVFFLRYIWRYLWRLIKGKDATYGTEENELLETRQLDSVNRQLFTLRQRIGEVAASQEKLLGMLTQLNSRQIASRNTSIGTSVDNEGIEDTG